MRKIKLIKIKWLAAFLTVLTVTFAMGLKTSLATPEGDFTPRWSMVVDSYNGYYKLKNEELAPIYKDLDRLNKIYDQQGDGVFDIAFFPDLRAKQFYEITPYSDSHGQPIADDDTIKKTIMEVRYLLNGNSMIKLAQDSAINMILNLIPKQNTNVIFARTSDTPFFRKTTNVCLVSYDPRSDNMWHARKAFFKTTKEIASKVGMYSVPDEAWHSFMTHLRAGLCVEKEAASWVIEPQGLVMNPVKTERKNRAYTFAFVYAALMAKREGHGIIMDKLIEIFKEIDSRDGVPVFTMKLLVADLHARGGSVRVNANVAYPFTPLDVLEQADKLDLKNYETVRDISDAVFRLVVEEKFDTGSINSRWMTEEFESYRMGF